MESNEFPIVVEDGRSRKRKRNDKDNKRGRLKIETYDSYLYPTKNKATFSMVHRYKQKKSPKNPSCSHPTKGTKKLECHLLEEADV